jgi:putative endonuclease
VDRQYYVYILTNRHNTVLYTGVTNDLVRRVHEHKSKQAAGFTRRYNVEKLVYFEVTGDVSAAIGREKQIKAGSRRKKIDLVTTYDELT